MKTKIFVYVFLILAVLLLSNPEIMQQEDDLRGLSKLMHLMRGISLLILCSHIYWFCHTWLSSQG